MTKRWKVPAKRRALMGALVLGLAGCVGMPHGQLSGGGKAAPPLSRGLSEFFVAPGCTQYFLQPQPWETNDGYAAEMDLTVRDSLKTIRFCRLMLSLTGASARATADSVMVSTPAGKLMPLAAPKLIFTEPHGKLTTTRWELYLTPDQAKNWLTSPQPQLVVTNQQGQRLRYQPTGRALRLFSALRQRLFSS